MTVKELHTFSPIEMDIIADALKIANSHYRHMAELMAHPVNRSLRDTFEIQARDAADLQLKIEAGR